MSKKINENTLRYALVSLYETINDLCCYDHSDAELERELQSLRMQVFDLVNARLPILSEMTDDEGGHE